MDHIDERFFDDIFSEIAARNWEAVAGKANHKKNEFVALRAQASGMNKRFAENLKFLSQMLIAKFQELHFYADSKSKGLAVQDSSLETIVSFLSRALPEVVRTIKLIKSE